MVAGVRREVRGREEVQVRGPATDGAHALRLRLRLRLGRVGKDSGKALDAYW